jgi:hypothetical protein
MGVYPTCLGVRVIAFFTLHQGNRIQTFAKAI